MITAGALLPSVYGGSPPLANAANLRTKGIELNITWKDAFKLGGHDFNYSITATYADYLTKITKYKNDMKILGGYYEGMTIGEIWGYKTGGLFQTDEEAAAYTSEVNCNNVAGGLPDGWHAGDLKILDLNGDGVINTGLYSADDSGDLAVIGNSEPRFQYGVTLTAHWNGIDFSAFFQGIGRINWYPPADNRNFWYCYSRPSSTWIPKNFMDNVWSETNTGAYFPRALGGLSRASKSYLSVTNDRYLQNLGYCRFKNLTIGYTLPKRITDVIRLAKVRVYFSGENLAYWSPIKKYNKYMDPENAINEGSSWLYTYPWQKTFSFGVDIDF